jgi:hypothetical protein
MIFIFINSVYVLLACKKLTTNICLQKQLNYINLFLNFCKKKNHGKKPNYGTKSFISVIACFSSILGIYLPRSFSKCNENFCGFSSEKNFYYCLSFIFVMIFFVNFLWLQNTGCCRNLNLIVY